MLQEWEHSQNLDNMNQTLEDENFVVSLCVFFQFLTFSYAQKNPLGPGVLVSYCSVTNHPKLSGCSTTVSGCFSGPHGVAPGRRGFQFQASLLWIP